MRPDRILLEGLSPRVRGNRSRRSGFYRHRRSIPACAGEPDSGLRRMTDSGVYPRVCGGTSACPRPPDDAHGLSPRVRGNPE